MQFPLINALNLLSRKGENGPEGERFEKYLEKMVPRKGLEPPRLAALAPEASASTNFATWAHPRCHTRA
jgi:hypothetical protein